MCTLMFWSFACMLRRTRSVQDDAVGGGCILSPLQTDCSLRDSLWSVWATSGRQCEGASRDEEACSLKAAPKLLDVFDSLIFNQVNLVHPATFPCSHAGLPTGLSRGAGKQRSQTHSGDFGWQDCELGDWSAWTTCNELSLPRNLQN